MAAENIVKKQYYPPSETARRLPQVTFSESGLSSTDLPRDTVLKSLQIRLSGAVTTTYGSGTPVADAQSIMDNLVQYFAIQIDGGRIVKSVRPHMLRLQQLYNTNVLAERRCSAAAAAATDNLALADAGMTYGTTGQVSTINETIMIDFQMPYCEPGTGRELTWLQLKGKASATLKIQMKPFSSLLGFGNTAPVVYSASTLVFDVITCEAQDVDPELEFLDFRQTHFDEPFSSETTSRAIDLNLNQKLAGIMMFAKDGAAGTATTASGKVASNLLLTNVSLKQNGRIELVNTTARALQNKNRAEFGITAPFANSVSILDGAYYINLLARKNIDTALDCRKPITDTLYLYLSTNTASNVSYTNPAIVTIMTDEIVAP